MLQIVVFSIFLGAGDSPRPAARPIHEADRRGWSRVMFKMVGFVMRFAPCGVGGRRSP